MGLFGELMFTILVATKMLLSSIRENGDKTVSRCLQGFGGTDRNVSGGCFVGAGFGC